MMIRRKLNSKGAIFIEVAASALFFIALLVAAEKVTYAIFDASRDVRSISVAGDLVHQIFREDPAPGSSDFSRITAYLKDAKYIGEAEDYALIVSAFENNASTGHVRVFSDAVGPNTESVSRVSVQGSSDPEPGIHLGSHIYHIDTRNIMYVVELYTGQRGSNDTQGGSLPYYEVSVTTRQR